MGPSLDDYEVTDLGLSYHYTPDPGYKMALTVRSTAPDSIRNPPPHFAIWLENASQYHIKTLHTPTGEDARASLPYWDFKRRGWEEAKQQAETSGNDLLERNSNSMPSRVLPKATPLILADYILPGDAEESLPYRLLIEINQPGDEQASMVYAVDIDNITPRTFHHFLDLVGYPKREEDDEDRKRRTGCSTTSTEASARHLSSSTAPC